MGIQETALFLIGMVLVIGGAELVLRGASRLAARLGIRPMLIGLTVVSIGTSAPELAVGITAAAEGSGALAVGNIAGTNIFNILFILGLSAFLKPLPIQILSIRLDLPVMIFSATLLIWMSWDGVLTRLEGGLLLLLAVLYTVALVYLTRRESSAVKREFVEEYGAAAVSLDRSKLGTSRYLTLVLGGVAVTVWGAHLLVEGAVGIARILGVSDAVIGLTIVAVGTSAPELATTIVGTLRNDRDVAIGNLVGSSIYNILAILGITCLAAPEGIPVTSDVLLVDLPLAAAVALVCVPVFATGRLVSRWEGGFFLAAYGIYMTTLIVYRL